MCIRDRCCEREFLAEDESAQQEHGEIKAEYEYVKGNVEIVLGGKTESGRTAGNDTGGQQESYDRKRIDCISCQNKENIAYEF